MSKVWDKARKKTSSRLISTVIIDVHNINYCDGTGIAMLADLLLEAQRRTNVDITLEGLKKDFQQLLDQFDLKHFKSQTDTHH